MNDESLAAQIQALTEAKDGAYRERNQVVALAAALAFELHNLGFEPFDAWRSEHVEDPNVPWDPEWRHVVYIQIPKGALITESAQLSWHVHDSEISLFEFLPLRLTNAWDGHTTEEKYERIRRYVES